MIHRKGEFSKIKGTICYVTIESAEYLDICNQLSRLFYVVKIGQQLTCGSKRPLITTIGIDYQLTIHIIINRDTKYYS